MAQKKNRVFRCACDRLILPKGLKCIFGFFGPLSDSARLAIAEPKIVVPWRETTVFFFSKCLRISGDAKND